MTKIINALARKTSIIGKSLGVLALTLGFASTASADPNGGECPLLTKQMANEFGFNLGAELTLMTIDESLDAYISARADRGRETSEEQIAQFLASRLDQDDADQITRPFSTIARGDRVKGNEDGNVCVYLFQESDPSYSSYVMLTAENIYGKNIKNDDNPGQISK